MHLDVKQKSLLDLECMKYRSELLDIKPVQMSIPPNSKPRHKDVVHGLSPQEHLTRRQKMSHFSLSEDSLPDSWQGSPQSTRPRFQLQKEIDYMEQFTGGKAHDETKQALMHITTSKMINREDLPQPTPKAMVAIECDLRTKLTPQEDGRIQHLLLPKAKKGKKSHHYYLQQIPPITEREKGSTGFRRIEELMEAVEKWSRNDQILPESAFLARVKAIRQCMNFRLLQAGVKQTQIVKEMFSALRP
eukprot:GHVH01017313.1.p1 GENE.GHVH01017313.1~~GHVH01017313.1.p1  ORF type:complete len:255 (-),score=39.58 GHVH01017313.1:35-772(-)